MGLTGPQGPQGAPAEFGSIESNFVINTNYDILLEEGYVIVMATLPETASGPVNMDGHTYYGRAVMMTISPGESDSFTYPACTWFKVDADGLGIAALDYTIRWQPLTPTA